MRAVLADTGPLYAALDPDDENHGRAQENIELLNLQELGIVVAYPTLCESYSLILYKLGIPAAHGWLDELRENASLINPTQDDYGRASERLLGYRDQGFSMFDSIVACLSERLEFPVWTFDHHFDVMRVEVWRDT
ncbi:MAG: type II toxin-antitoxin system VapC family toxin [Rubrobacteraceae bacterium]